MNAQNESNSPNPEQPGHDAGASQEGGKSVGKQELLPTPNELVALLSKRVIGHEQAKRSIAVAVYQHLLNSAKCDTYGGRVETENHVLLLGSSGSGKSLLLRTLGDVLKLPLFFIPCTNIANNGYKGKDFSQHLETISSAIVDEKFTHPAIVVWDEVDKLSIYGDNDSAAAVYRRMIQMDFLTFLDGTKCGNENEMDSSRILSIACGAFVGMDAIRNPQTKPVIGFGASAVAGQEALQPLSPEHLIRYGLLPEFVGRFSRLTTLDPLDRSVMRRILTEADGNVLSRRKEFFGVHGVRLEITDDAIDAVVSKAMDHGTGARALRLVVDQILRGVEHRLPDMALEGVSALVIDRDAVLGLTPPIEHKGKQTQSNLLLELRRLATYSKSRTPFFDNDDDILGIF